MAGEKQSFATTTKMQIRSTLTQLTIRARLCPNPSKRNRSQSLKTLLAWESRLGSLQDAPSMEGGRVAFIGL